jgi:hypothetical protein
MSLSSRSRAELVDLVTRLQDDDTAADNRSRVLKLVATDADAHEFYVDYCHMTACLRWTLGPAASVDVRPGLTGPLQVGVSNRLPQPSKHSSLASPQQIPILRFPRSVTNTFSIATVAATLLVAVLIYGAFGYLAWDLRRDKATGTASSSQLTVAMIEGTADVRWSRDTMSRTGNASIRSGEPLKIDSGAIELLLNAGAKLLIEGPAEWSIDGDNQATLRAGKLVATVPSQAVGFLLETPTSRIVDLGTEFGVEVDRQGSTEVQVITGKVALKSASSLQALPEQIINAGTARKIQAIGGNTLSVSDATWRPQDFNLAKRISTQSTKQIQIRGVMASSYHSFFFSERNLINGSGLTGNAHTEQMRLSNDSGTMWSSSVDRVRDEFILFNLGHPHRLEQIKIWNYNDSHIHGATGAARVDVCVSDASIGDPISTPDRWKRVATDQPLRPAPGLNTYDTPDVIPLRGVVCRYVVIVINDKLPPDTDAPLRSYPCVGLSEVQFFGTPVEGKRQHKN